MNICFLTGEIIQEIEFNFLYNSPNISVAKTKLKLQNNAVVQIYAYDELADKLYAKLFIGEILFCEGMLISENRVILNNIIKE